MTNPPVAASLPESVPTLGDKLWAAYPKYTLTCEIEQVAELSESRFLPYERVVVMRAVEFEAFRSELGSHLPELLAALADRPPKKAYYDNPVMIDGFPRSHRMDHWTPVERAIHEVLQVVEGVGAHPLLTDAVTLLGDAQRRVAEWVDHHSNPATTP